MAQSGSQSRGGGPPPSKLCLCQRSANYGPWATFSPPPTFVNKVLLETALFIYVLLIAALLYSCRVESLQQRPDGPQSLNYLFSGSSQERLASLWSMQPLNKSSPSLLRLVAQGLGTELV